MRPATAKPFQIRRALRALVALNADPDETSHVFTIIEALSGSSHRHLVALFEQSEDGQHLLRARPELIPILADRDALRRMPEGSLAHAYLRFVESEGITADGLVAASDASESRLHEEGSDIEFVANRMRDTHDLWHAVTGYQGDVLGETSLLAFNVPQTRNVGVALITILGFTRVRRLNAWRVIAGGLRRGMQARSLPPVHWEQLLPLPLEEVRARLRIQPARAYEPVRTSTLREEGSLPPRPAMAM